MEPGEGQEGHSRKRLQTALNLEFNLVVGETWMSHHVMVEYELVRETCEDKIEEVYANQGDDN